MTHYQHVYLSPHLDDAALSCGGAIHQLVQGGEAVLVITVFAGSPRLGQSGEAGGHSDLVSRLHQRWQTIADAPALRRIEDEAAMRVLGADLCHLTYLDCIYRRHPLSGEFLYRSEQAIFGQIHLAELALVAGLQSELSARIGAAGQATLYAPLTAGHHVDHQVVAAAALALGAAGHRVVFYEDYPYAETPGQVAAARQRLGGDNWQQELLPLSLQALQARTNAVLCYRSQLSTFFQSDSEVSERLHAYAMTPAPHLGPCERIWHLTK